MDWRHRALCREEDPELFFPLGSENQLGGGKNPAVLAQIDEAKTVCRTCPVVSECLAWAIESGQDYGVWGGMSEAERRAFKRRGRVADRYRTNTYADAKPKKRKSRAR